MCEFCGQASHRIPEATSSGNGTSSGQAANGKPVYSVEQVAQYLYEGYWEETGRGQRSFDVQSGGS